MEQAEAGFQHHVFPVILAGGAGTRLWPLSRELYPKQMMPLVSSHSMLQNTALRVSGLEEFKDPIVICNENHRFLVAEQFRSINIKPAAVIVEPVGRNTAPAIAVAAMEAMSLDKDAIILILPSDHHIEGVENFHESLKTAYHLSQKGYLVTFGVIPKSPETGYGYIQKGNRVDAPGQDVEAFTIHKFFEKPDLQNAKAYLDSESFYWNSGMFMFLASTILEELSKFFPQIVDDCKNAYGNGLEDLDFYRLNAEEFKKCPSESIDCAVMERTEKGAVVSLDAAWNDLGSWSALWGIGVRDEDQNVMVGDVLAHEVKNSYLHATSRLVAAIGVQNHVIVETPDAVFISPWDRVQDVKLLVQKLKTGKREEALSHKKVYRPWGSYESISLDNRFQVKRITVKPGAILSLQKHHHRAEHWVVVSGTALITSGNDQFLLKEDESTYIPLGVNHRLENPGKIPLEIIEVQTGSYLGEDDIVRFEDVYGRQQ